MNNDENKKELSAEEEVIEAENSETEEIEINSEFNEKATTDKADSDEKKPKKKKSSRIKRLNPRKHQDKRCLRRDLIILLVHW